MYMDRIEHKTQNEDKQNNNTTHKSKKTTTCDTL